MNEACIDLYNQCITLYESAVLRNFCRRRAGLAQFFPPIKHRPIHIDLYEDLTLGRTDDLIFTAREDALLCIRISCPVLPWAFLLPDTG